MTSGPDSEELALLVHEVRSPVAALAAIAEAVEVELDPTSLRELSGLALRAVRSLDRIVGDAALGSLRLQPVDVARLLEDVAAAAQLEGRRLTVQVVPPLLVEADPVRLRQALDNLIGNAFTHSRSPAGVTVSARAEGDTLVLAVSDRGRGIDPADQEAIFAPGARLDTIEDGQGLGLAVVRAVAEAHGGSVSVESEPGRGAMFTIRLPLGASPQA